MSNRKKACLHWISQILYHIKNPFHYEFAATTAWNVFIQKESRDKRTKRHQNIKKLMEAEEHENLLNLNGIQIPTPHTKESKWKLICFLWSSALRSSYAFLLSLLSEETILFMVVVGKRGHRFLIFFCDCELYTGKFSFGGWLLYFTCRYILGMKKMHLKIRRFYFARKSFIITHILYKTDDSNMLQSLKLCTTS